MISSPEKIVEYLLFAQSSGKIFSNKYPAAGQNQGVCKLTIRSTLTHPPPATVKPQTKESQELRT